MGAKRSEEMKWALKLILEQGKSPAEAARLAGVTKGAISQTPEYRKFKGEKKNES